MEINKELAKSLGIGQTQERDFNKEHNFNPLLDYFDERIIKIEEEIKARIEIPTLPYKVAKNKLSLIVAATDSGKTTHAISTGLTIAALPEEKVMFVSAEEHPDDIIERLIPTRHDPKYNDRYKRFALNFVADYTIEDFENYFRALHKQGFTTIVIDHIKSSIYKDGTKLLTHEMLRQMLEGLILTFNKLSEEDIKFTIICYIQGNAKSKYDAENPIASARGLKGNPIHMFMIDGGIKSIQNANNTCFLINENGQRYISFAKGKNMGGIRPGNFWAYDVDQYSFEIKMGEMDEPYSTMFQVPSSKVIIDQTQIDKVVRSKSKKKSGGGVLPGTI